MNPDSEFQVGGCPQDSSLPERGCPKCGSDFMLFTESLSPEVLCLTEDIGNGAFGTVKKGLYYTAPVAVKQFNTPYGCGSQSEHSEHAVKMMRREAQMLWNLRHPNILTPYAVTCVPPQIVTAYYPMGSLRDNLNKGTRLVKGWKCIHKLLKGMTAGMRYFHERDHPVLHRDLKSHNILISNDGQAVICDVGLSIFLDEMEPMDLGRNGTLNCAWQPPEVILNKQYSQKSDMYSMAIITWELLTGKLPFRMDELRHSDDLFLFNETLKDRIVKGERPELPPEATIENKVPAGYVELMQLCWSQDPKNRPTFDEFDYQLMQLWEEHKGTIATSRSASISIEHAQSMKAITVNTTHDSDAWLLGICILYLISSALQQKVVIDIIQGYPYLNLVYPILNVLTVGSALFVLMWLLGRVVKNSMKKKQIRFPQWIRPVTVKFPAKRSPFENGPPLNCSFFHEKPIDDFPRPSSEAWPEIRESSLKDVNRILYNTDGQQEHLMQIQSFCQHHEAVPDEETWQKFRKILQEYLCAPGMLSYDQYTHPRHDSDASETPLGIACVYKDKLEFFVASVDADSDTNEAASSNSQGYQLGHLFEEA